MMRVAAASSLALVLAAAALSGPRAAAAFDLEESQDPLDLFEVTNVRDLRGNPIDLDSMAGRKVVLIANIASECGFTQSGYEQLSELASLYQHRGLEVFGAPCNQFGAQEPGSADEIAEFAASKHATFTLLEKQDVNGPDSSELFKFLRGEFFDESECHDATGVDCKALDAEGKCDSADHSGYMLDNCARTCDYCEPPYEFGGDLKWNFETFLVGFNGEVVARWPTGTDLLSAEVKQEIEASIEEVEAMMDEEEYVAAAYDAERDEL